jgi:hypothetical protein
MACRIRHVVPIRQPYTGSFGGAFGAQAVAKEARHSMAVGHIISLPFSNGFGDAVAEAVQNTSVHMATGEHAKFAVAAQVERSGTKFVCWMHVYVVHVQEIQ